MTWVLLALAGGLGAVLRDRTAQLLDARPHGALAATAVVNLAGALALGLLVGLAAGDRTLAVVGTGLLGGLTTFSTWLVHVADGPSRHDPPVVRVSVVVGQLVAGPLLAALGVAVGRTL